VDIIKIQARINYIVGRMVIVLTQLLVTVADRKCVAGLEAQLFRPVLFRGFGPSVE
jgi:hypothetical protein